VIHLKTPLKKVHSWAQGDHREEGRVFTGCLGDFPDTKNALSLEQRFYDNIPSGASFQPQQKMKKSTYRLLYEKKF
jgi:hypothetical protein